MADLNCIWLISTEAQMHYDTTVGCDLEVPLKGGGIQKLDHVHGHCERLTPSWPVLESGQNELLFRQAVPQLGNMFEKWIKLF